MEILRTGKGEPNLRKTNKQNFWGTDETQIKKLTLFYFYFNFSPEIEPHNLKSYLKNFLIESLIGFERT